jgi:hypothetical protein
VNWQDFADGTRAWVASTSKIHIDDVVWTGEPEGMLGRPCARLNLLGANPPVSSDEVRLVSQGPGEDAAVRIVGNRAIILNVLVQTRDGTPWGRAFRYLERLRDALFLPSTQQLFSELRVALEGPGVLVDLQRFVDFRRESAASLDLRMNYAFDTMCECGEGLTPETIGTIEHVRVAGTVYTPFGGDVDVVQVPEKQLDR